MSDTTAFFAAIRAGDSTAIEVALAEDPSLATAQERGVSAILTALYHGQEPIARRLVRGGAEPDFFEAAALGDLGRVADLLSADPGLASRQTADGFSALGLAAFFGHERAVALLARWSDPNVPSANGMRVTPLHSAAASPRTDARVPMCRALLSHGADPNLRQAGGFTPLHAAAHAGDRELVRVLLDYGADCHLTTDSGETAADLARANGHDELAESLAPAN
jgi:ankyrin repeat protein